MNYIGETIEHEILEKHILAGKIARKAQKKALELLKPGTKLLEIAQKIEDFIIKEKGFPAWPVNLSINQDAAHDTPAWQDERILGKEDLVKVDIGVSVEGYLADSAFSFNASGQWNKLIQTSEKALQTALETVKIGMLVGEIGKVIEAEIKSAGFNPVENLMGHGLGQYNQHVPPSIPNIAKIGGAKIEEEKAYAIEPFVSTGKGYVSEASGAEIFQENEVRNVRSAQARKILEHVIEKYQGLPFAERWIEQELKLGDFSRKTGLKELLQAKCIRAFPVLREQKGIYVAQSENSFIIHGGETIILVK
ncbi:MAG: type II methionyl aminopeptidase [Candidatus Diapherotrites archaeon]|nr:type II methionyl aminopeptidase [Candidatus Diapherotrites archaeon]